MHDTPSRTTPPRGAHTTVAAADPSDLCPTTLAVRAFYERFPYPDGGVQLRRGADPRALLARGRLPRGGAEARTRPIAVLDAGCGRALGLIGAALANPSVGFVGIDLNRAALAEARREARARGAANVRFAEVDLMTLAGLEVPEGGFDVVHSSGVVHHLADPRAGLARLGEVLAPHGVIDLMVYGTRGRVGIARVARSVRAATVRCDGIDQSIAVGRELCSALASPAADCPWRTAAEAPDVEFADRYLNPNETSYDVRALLELVTSAGLVPLDFLDPQELDPLACIADPRVAASVAALPPLERLALVEEIVQPSRHEVLLVRPGNGARGRASDTELLASTFRAHPDAAFETSVRQLDGWQSIEHLRVRVGARPTQDLRAGPLARLVLFAVRRSAPFTGAEARDELAAHGLSAVETVAALRSAEEQGLLLRPHGCDV